jgi:hypothetical protein
MQMRVTPVVRLGLAMARLGDAGEPDDGDARRRQGGEITVGHGGFMEISKEDFSHRRMMCGAFRVGFRRTILQYKWDLAKEKWEQRDSHTPTSC